MSPDCAVSIPWTVDDNNKPVFVELGWIDDKYEKPLSPRDIDSKLLNRVDILSLFNKTLNRQKKTVFEQVNTILYSL